MTQADNPDIAFIGMGEAGAAIVSGWGGGADRSIRAYDIKTDDPATAAAMAGRYRDLAVTGCATSAETVAGAGIVFSTVTADQAVIAAETAAPHITGGAFWCDLNSCAPSSKSEAASIIDAAGGRYVDVAVMASVHPKRNMVPLLISGPHAEAVLPLLSGLPMAPRLVAGNVGAASSIKMIRSVMVKGMEALTAECLLAAVASGVEEEVLASLKASHGGIDWAAQAAYNFERTMVHGERRAAEMEEVARTLHDLGLPDDMVRATTRWQRRIGGADIDVPDNARDEPAGKLAALLLSELKPGR